MKMILKMILLYTPVLVTILAINIAQGQNLDYRTDIEPIFTNNCTSIGCHVSGNEGGGLNLQVDISLGEITGATTTIHAPLVISGSPDISPLIWKLEGVDNNGADVFGARMPLVGGPLSQTTIDLIRQWIREGIVLSVISNDKLLPERFTLEQNYPNPFNPTTTIEYQLPNAGQVILTVSNLRGEEITRLIDKHQPAGKYQVLWNASHSSSGIYFYRLQSDGFVQTRKMLLLK